MSDGLWYESGFFWQVKLSKISRDSKMVHEGPYTCWHGLTQNVNNQKIVENGHFILGGGRS